jgi:Tfp pilus assembly protein PilN
MNKQKTELDEVDSQLHFIFDLRESSYRAVRLLNELAIANPESVTLFKLVRNGDDITVFGKAKSNLQITMFMDNLEKAKIFTQPDLTEITGKEGEVGDERKFELKMQQLR